MTSFSNTTMIAVQPMYPPLPVQSSLLLTIAVCSVPCFIFLLYHLLTTRLLYTALNNHVIILLLISNALQTLVDVPVQLAYFYTGIFWPPDVRYCVFCYYIDYWLFTTCFLLLTWASFERHILIFHSRWYNKRGRRLLGHYLPLGFCCLYPPSTISSSSFSTHARIPTTSPSPIAHLRVIWLRVTFSPSTNRLPMGSP